MNFLQCVHFSHFALTVFCFKARARYLWSQVVFVLLPSLLLEFFTFIHTGKWTEYIAFSLNQKSFIIKVSQTSTVVLLLFSPTFRSDGWWGGALLMVWLQTWAALGVLGSAMVGVSYSHSCAPGGCHRLSSLGSRLWDTWAGSGAGNVPRICLLDCGEQRKLVWEEGEVRPVQLPQDLSQSFGGHCGWDGPSELSWAPESLIMAYRAKGHDDGPHSRAIPEVYW